MKLCRNYPNRVLFRHPSKNLIIMKTLVTTATKLGKKLKMKMFLSKTITQVQNFISELNCCFGLISERSDPKTNEKHLSLSFFAIMYSYIFETQKKENVVQCCDLSTWFVHC